MGSQTIDIFRQGIWASITGGWFYDPHQNVFSNVVHLYIWLFFLCTPFFTYIYFPRNLVTWVAYSTVTVILVSALKVLNMALHILYDRSQAMTDNSSKKALRDGDCGGIEMQVLGLENSFPSAKMQHYEGSTANSIVSLDCVENVGTIDFKVDVHRKNSSGSNESVGEENLKNVEAEVSVAQNLNDKPIEHEGETKNTNRLKKKNHSLDEGDIMQDSNKKRSEKTKKLNRQSSFDISRIEKKFHNDSFSNNVGLQKPEMSSPNFRRDASTDSIKDNRNMIFSPKGLNDQHSKMLKNSMQLYSESTYAKSDFGIENLDETGNTFSLEICHHMLKDSNNTTSAIMLPLYTTSSHQAHKRRYSNTGSKVLSNPPIGVRRIKSAALETSCHGASVSNLTVHPNSAETISGQQVKGAQNMIFPPPSKCLIRNPHLNLCLEIDNLSGIDPVYPIAEQIDEKYVSEDFCRSTDVENSTTSISQQRSSTTESESDLDRSNCRSTDDTDVNGSRSPLLNRSLGAAPSQIERQVRGCLKNVFSESRANSQSGNSSKAATSSHSNDPGGVSNKDKKSRGAIPKAPRLPDDVYVESEDSQNVAQAGLSSVGSSSTSLRSFECDKNLDENYTPYKDEWLVNTNVKRLLGISPNILPMANDVTFRPHTKLLTMETNYKLTPILTRSNAIKRPKKNDDFFKDIVNEFPMKPDIVTDFRKARISDDSVTDFMQLRYQEQPNSQMPSSGTTLTFRKDDLNGSGYCDYWQPCSLPIEQQIPQKRCYKYRINCLGGTELKIKMDRLQLLALFDRDLNWLHVILSVLLSIAICLLGSTVLNLGIYKDICIFLFCLVIAGSQYSLLKSVQPDAASPIHGFNKAVAYSRPVYFCLFSSFLLLSQYTLTELRTNGVSRSSQTIYGIRLAPLDTLEALTTCLSIIVLLFPILFSLGLFPQFNTFCTYALEQIDMHVFGGTAVVGLLASFLGVLKSVAAVCIVYIPLYGSLSENSTQHVWFSVFCGMLIALCYHLSRCPSDYTHTWSLVKASFFKYAAEDDEVNKPVAEACNERDNSNEKSDPRTDKTESKTSENTSRSSMQSVDMEHKDLLAKKLKASINSRLKNDLVVCSVIGIVTFALHSTTVFTALQPDLNKVLFSIACVLGFFVHYLIPQLRKHLPWLCFSRPILKQQEFGRFEVGEASKIMWFEKLYVYLCFLEKNILYPLIFISILTADSQKVVNKFGLPLGATAIAISAIKGVRGAFADSANQYMIVTFCVLIFNFDYSFASETFLLDYFLVSTAYRKFCDFLLKVQFVVTYIAPWQITWGSAFHAFAQPFSVPHSAMLFIQMVTSAIFSTPLNPFLGSAIFLTSYARPIKFWERDYNTRRIDHSNTRLSSQLERDLGADDNNLNSIFYEHLTRSLQRSLCGDLLLGRWGNVNQGDCFVLASDYLNCLVHIIEVGNGMCTFQMRGLEFRGTYCQQREVEAISEGIEDNDGFCCCSPGHLPNMLSANAMFSTRWLAWQVVAAQYVLEGYSISENLATATLQLFEFRKVLITYYIKSIIYYVTQSKKLDEWLEPGPIQEALETTLNRQFVDLDPIFNYNLDEDFDFRPLGITRGSFCYVYLNWIQFCYSKRKAESEARSKTKNISNSSKTPTAESSEQSQSNATGNENGKAAGCSDNENCNGNTASNENTIGKDSQLVSLCLALSLLARRSLATASHGSLSGVEFFLHGLHALFKGDFRITSPRDEWVFADMELLHGVVAPAVKMGLKLHQDHFSSPDEYLDPSALYDAIKSYSEELVISHEADPVWRSAVLRGASNLLALRHVMEDGSDEYRIIRLTKRYLSFRVIKLNRECVRGLWAGQQQELVYLRNRNPERGSIQNAKQALRNIINSSCDQPIGYPIYVSPLTTSYAETNEQLCKLIGGSITLDSIQNLLLNYWKHIKRRCHEGCSSGSGVIDGDVINEPSSSYYLPNSTGNFAAMTCSSQTLPCSSIRGSLANVSKPTNSALLVGFLNREREADRENNRERHPKKSLLLKTNEKCERDKVAPSPPGSTMEFSSQFSECSRKLVSCSGSYSMTISSNSSEQLSEKTRKHSSENSILTESANPILLEVNKKVIIVDGTEIYDCLDLRRRIDVIWPNEKMRLNGGRSSWNDWSPKEGMVGFVVHYWQPNHPDLRFRSNVNRTLYLIAIGNRYVPIGERGIKEYKQIGLDMKLKKILSANESEADSSLTKAEATNSKMK